MQTSDAYVHGKSNDSEWELLAEYPMVSYLSDQGQTDKQPDRLLFQTLREFDVHIEFIENIKMTLAKIANIDQEGFEVRNLGLPGQIRIFYQKKIMEEANSASVPLRSVLAEKPVESARIIPEAGMVMSSGWGFFILERAADNADSNEKTGPIVDIYFYKEGS